MKNGSSRRTSLKALPKPLVQLHSVRLQLGGQPERVRASLGKLCHLGSIH